VAPSLRRSQLWIKWREKVNRLIKSNQKMLNKLKKIKIDKYFAISYDIMNRLEKMGISSEYYNLNLVDINLFKPINVNCPKKNKIFIFLLNK
jgi:hypothetical protein